MKLNFNSKYDFSENVMNIKHIIKIVCIKRDSVQFYFLLFLISNDQKKKSQKFSNKSTTDNLA